MEDKIINEIINRKSSLNFSNEKIKSYEKINMKLKEENRLKNSTLEIKLRKRQKSIFN